MVSGRDLASEYADAESRWPGDDSGILGAHYAYLGKWGLQFLFWITLGGLGIWALIDLFLIPGKVAAYNAVIYEALDKIEKMEKEEDHRRHIESLKALSNKD